MEVLVWLSSLRNMLFSEQKIECYVIGSDRERSGELREIHGGKTVFEIYCLKEEFVFN